MTFWELLRRLRRLLPFSAPQGGGQRRHAVDQPFTILVAGVVGDGDGRLADAVAACLNGRAGLAIRRSPTVPGPVDDTEKVALTLSSAARHGRVLTDALDADLVVWGERRGPFLRLRFLPTVLQGEAGHGCVMAGDLLDLPLPFDRLADLVAAAAVAALHVADEEEQRQRYDVLRPLVPAAERAASGLPLPYPAACRPSVLVALAAIASQTGFATGQRSLLDRALAHLREAVSLGGASMGAAQIAAVRAHAADILADLGGRDRDTTMLEEATRHYRAAQEQFGAKLMPEEYAHLMTQLARAFHRLSAIANRPVLMKEAAMAYREASRVWTRAGRPDRWAELQNGIGTMLGQLGEFTGNVEILERAAQVFEAAGEVWTRERQPRRWAGLQNNIGACRFAEGKRTHSRPPMRDAAERFARALEVYQALNMVRNVHVTQKNLARVERLLNASAD